jgi:hypothetical protein
MGKKGLDNAVSGGGFAFTGRTSASWMVRRLVYDREGKVVGAWLGLPGEHGPEKALQKLFQDEQSRANN